MPTDEQKKEETCIWCGRNSQAAGMWRELQQVREGKYKKGCPTSRKESTCVYLSDGVFKQ